MLWTALTATIAGLLLPPAMLTVALLPLLLTAPLAGLANQSAKICCDTILQRRMPDDALGRVFSIVDLTVNAGLVVGVALVAFLAPPDAVSIPLFLAIGAAYLLVAAVVRADPGAHAGRRPRPGAALSALRRGGVAAHQARRASSAAGPRGPRSSRRSSRNRYASPTSRPGGRQDPHDVVAVEVRADGASSSCACSSAMRCSRSS